MFRMEPAIRYSLVSIEQIRRWGGKVRGSELWREATKRLHEFSRWLITLPITRHSTLMISAVRTLVGFISCLETGESDSLLRISIQTSFERCRRVLAVRSWGNSDVETAFLTLFSRCCLGFPQRFLDVTGVLSSTCATDRASQVIRYRGRATAGPGVYRRRIRTHDGEPMPCGNS